MLSAARLLLWSLCCPFAILNLCSFFNGVGGGARYGSWINYAWNYMELNDEKLNTNYKIDLFNVMMLEYQATLQS